MTGATRLFFLVNRLNGDRSVTSDGDCISSMCEGDLASRSGSPIGSWSEEGIQCIRIDRRVERFDVRWIDAFVGRDGFRNNGTNRFVVRILSAIPCCHTYNH